MLCLSARETEYISADWPGVSLPPPSTHPQTHVPDKLNVSLIRH